MTPFTRFSAASGVLCGLFIGVPGAVEAVTGETAPTSFVLGVSPALAVPLLTALYLGQRERAGTAGLVAYAVNLIGLGLFGGAAYTLNIALFYLDRTALAALLQGPTRAVLLGSAVVFAVGSVLFAISMVRARVHPAVPAWGYGLTLAPFALLAPLPDTVLTSALHVLAGACLVWLALSLRVPETGPASCLAGARRVSGSEEKAERG
ncbi:hypothetical protein [Sphaerisporangium corydalis]|uniref:DUF4386 domain-containing protein n=1 Tax=Sphaerisporangium corydalis TaxID=1441875 RepID=A0ABV9E7A6_9ACTN|nr:hypothetical protein [Sphaerisporangium corydalis]